MQTSEFHVNSKREEKLEVDVRLLEHLVFEM